MISESLIRVRYAETDQMAVVYHSNYFVWFEIGRTDFFRKLGMSYRDLEEKNVILPVIDVGCRYKVSAKYDDEIIIRTKLVKIKGVRLEFNYEIYRKEDNQLLAEGHTIHAFVDKDLKPVNFKRMFREIWDRLCVSIE